MATPPATGFCSSRRFEDHRTTPHHPERPDRIRAVLSAVSEAGLVAFHDHVPEAPVDFGFRATPPAAPPRPLTDLGEPAPAPEGAILVVHPREYVERIRRICAAGGGVLD